jgi:hypothetical protein
MGMQTIGVGQISQRNPRASASARVKPWPFVHWQGKTGVKILGVVMSYSVNASSAGTIKFKPKAAATLSLKLLVSNGMAAATCSSNPNG